MRDIRWRISLLMDTKDYGYGWLANFKCQLFGHGKMIWFTSSPLKPDTRCENCNEDLG